MVAHEDRSATIPLCSLSGAACPGIAMRRRAVMDRRVAGDRPGFHEPLRMAGIAPNRGPPRVAELPRVAGPFAGAASCRGIASRRGAVTCRGDLPARRGARRGLHEPSRIAPDRRGRLASQRLLRVAGVVPHRRDCHASQRPSPITGPPRIARITSRRRGPERRDAPGPGTATGRRDRHALRRSATDRRSRRGVAWIALSSQGLPRVGGTVKHCGDCHGSQEPSRGRVDCPHRQALARMQIPDLRPLLH
ncbi:hypothetical protein DFR70_10796 [Nocardia tenerifensis]|uniref:Uncharacterized protein n=1 Tax=Nocardia tenerifensis TaxID=228006 RepID=A0A318KB16_9NOCA|nr:hypothetical protein DFR70_10796 [Nocardia tenerifensis]